MFVRAAGFVRAVNFCWAVVFYGLVKQWRSQGHCFGGASSERRKHSRGSAPNFYLDLDFSNGLEQNWGGVAP